MRPLCTLYCQFSRFRFSKGAFVPARRDSARLRKPTSRMCLWASPGPAIQRPLGRRRIHNGVDILVVAVGRARIRQDPAYPRGYDCLFDRRLRFAMCRFALNERKPDWAVVQDIGARTKQDQFVVRMLPHLPAALGALVGLIWLTMRFRPVALRSIIGTALSRDRVPGRGVAGGGAPRSPAWAGQVSWRLPEG